MFRQRFETVKPQIDLGLLFFFDKDINLLTREQRASGSNEF
jgi:hypothetical protein